MTHPMALMTNGPCEKVKRAGDNSLVSSEVSSRLLSSATAFRCPRDFLDNRFVYILISPRARGLSVGVDMNPDKQCNFDCLYCEVNRAEPAREQTLDLGVTANELSRTLEFVRSDAFRKRPPYSTLPDELLELRHVALSGDGEPTLSPSFADAVEAVMHVRAQRKFPFFKIVLITNATGLDRPEVQRSLRYFTPQDEIWAKLDAGTQSYMNQLNRPDCGIEKILANILLTARQRPVIIQSLFTSLRGEGPSSQEIEHYAKRLSELKQAGAHIPLVQIYSATRPTPHSECGHLPLRTLSLIAQAVRKIGLRAEVF